MLFRLDAELNSLERRQEQLDWQFKTAMAFGWDHVAMARRLAVLEDHVDGLLSRGETTPPADSGRPLIRYAGPERQRVDEPQHFVSPQSSVG
jgi:hypothetical protein